MKRIKLWGLGLLLIIGAGLGGCNTWPAGSPPSPGQNPAAGKVITVSQAAAIDLIRDPQHPDVIYQLQFNGKDEEAAQVFAGAYSRRVSLHQVGKEPKLPGGEAASSIPGSKQIAADLPFITRARWSADGRYLALNGNEELYVYDRQTEKITLINEVVNTPSVTHFGFGPGNIIYTEHENLPNDVIYDPLKDEGNPAYKIDGQPLYYKEDLGAGLYAATVVKDGTKTSVEEVYTVITDTSGKIISRVAPGRYRDRHGMSILNVGAEHFGLYYVGNYMQPQPRPIYSGYVYQTAFSPAGEVFYTRSGTSDKGYLLCRYEPKTKKTWEQPVSGPYFVISPEGQLIYGGGWQSEQINPQSLQIKAQTQVSIPENRDVIQALYGAVATYIKYYCYPGTDADKRQQELARWYVNTDKPVMQSAFFDITEELTARGDYKVAYYEDDGYLWSGSIKLIEVKADRASVVARLGARTASGSGWGYEAAYELIKTEAGWRVTGLSTFPTSSERKRVEATVKKFIAKAQQGDAIAFGNQDSTRVYQEIKQKPLQMGQIQFWRMSEPHKSPTIESSNHAKVYLYAGGKTYKLMLEKKKYGWQITGLSGRNLSYLW